jgi:hypothetical protein
MELKTIFSDAHSAVLSKAFNDDNVDNVDYEILKLAAVSDEDTTNAMEAYIWNDAQSDVYHPTIQELRAEEQLLPRMKRLAEAGYLIESEEENTPGIYKDFKLNLNTSK